MDANESVSVYVKRSTKEPDHTAILLGNSYLLTLPLQISHWVYWVSSVYQPTKTDGKQATATC